MRRTIVAVVVALQVALAAAGVSGCTAGTSSDPLDDRTFVSTSVTGHDLVPGTRISLSFGAGALSAEAGCNHLGAGYTLDGSTLRISGLSMTEMACEPTTKMDQDQWLADLLASGPGFTLDGRTLTLTSGAVRIDLSEQITVDRPLAGTHWELQTIVTGTGSHATAEDASLETDPATLVIGDGHVAVSAGVNGGSGPLTVSGSTLTFGHLLMTLRPIADDRRGRIETAVLGVLHGTVDCHIDGDTLTITAEDGATALVYRAVTDATSAQ